MVTMGEATPDEATPDEAAPDGVAPDGVAPGSGESLSVVVGLVADPGLPTRIVRRLADKLPTLLATRIDASVAWQARVASHTLPLDEDDVFILSNQLTSMKSREGWDIAIYVTDLPRFASNRVVVTDVDTENGLAIVSLPALGLGLSRRTSIVLLHILGKIYAADATPDAGRGRRLKGMMTPVGATLTARAGIDSYAALKEPQGSLRLLIGMVLSNRHWRLVADLSSMMAAAAATGAFGIFYASIAHLSDQMGETRLGLTTLAVILTITLWLPLHHRLWETPGGHRRRSLIYNGSSLASIAIGVVCMYAVLLAVLIAAAWLVIPPEYLNNQLGHMGSFADYFDLSWLAASMGMAAGAIGSSFDSGNKIRNALYSSREANRRQHPDNTNDTESAS